MPATDCSCYCKISSSLCQCHPAHDIQKNGLYKNDEGRIEQCYLYFTSNATMQNYNFMILIHRFDKLFMSQFNNPLTV